jgi:hypothetical protein
MPHSTGRRMPLSLPRRFICDVVHYARQVPSVPTQRRMRLAEVVAARAAASPRPGWCAIFTKAYGIVAAGRPELRRAYIPFPWPHLYEHPDNIATVGIERHFNDEDAVFFARIRTPNILSLTDLDRHVRHFKEAPIEDIGAFRHALKVSSLPLPLRRLIWWLGLHSSGRRRAKHFGTFGISVVAALGAASLHQLSPLTTALNYGVLEPDGSLEVRLTYDHRVLDGGNAARALTELERVLRGEILAELRYLRGVEAA